MRRATGITVNLDQSYQTMDGFGFSQAFGRASDLYNLEGSLRTYALDLLFNTTTGAGMTILRNRVGSGGTGDSIEPTSPVLPVQVRRMCGMAVTPIRSGFPSRRRAMGLKLFMPMLGALLGL
jgi:hypothetical protein